MTAVSTDPHRLADLREIHAAAKRRGLDPQRHRDLYEAFLYHQVGAASARDLSPEQRAQVLRALGVDPERVRAWRPDPRPENVSEAQWKYIGDLCVQLHLDDQRFSALVRHIVGLDAWAWLDVPKARALIAGLLRIQAAKPRTRVPARGNPRRVGA